MSSLFRYSRWASQFKKSPPIFTSFSTATTDAQPNRPSPPPIRVGLTDSVGRAVFATRRIGAGELIHTAKPIVAHPSLPSLHKVCYFCLRKLPSQKPHSEAHKNVAFCSEHCKDQSKNFYEIEKKADWSRFNEYCRLQGLKYPLLVKRFACQVMSGVVSADILDILQPANLTSEMVSMMEKEFCLLRSTFQETDIKGEQMAFLTKEWYTGVLARMRINAFRVELPGGSYEDLLSSAAASIEAEIAVGNAVYMLPSFYNHDCDPNAHILWMENVDARLKTLRNIEAGEELRICYIDASMNYKTRQTVLYEGFGFLCNCPRCLSND
ncbi:histone-lysine N-methyltransferase ATXR4 [Olea europaea subsp. europaea]|uniref:Histone-lysine N-methyltransferase ATXR4 n=1 Tax=Olea europaea subsp. europaea TaxID=158383 RepID=A0A8S0SD86_OLEEU|nr:histone-lysine N-methyltransferase ATXR4 [Olea europaea subsp. europaea]